VAKKKKSDNTAMNVGMGVAGGALVGAGLGSRRAGKTERRIPAAASRMVNRSIRDVNRFENSAVYDRERMSNANKIRFGDNDATRETRRFQAGQADRYADDARANDRKAADIKRSGLTDLSVRKDMIRNKLGAAPKVAKNRTKKYVKRGAAAGGALALLASLVAKELGKSSSGKTTKKRG
jgi:hypothetical protein